jgi:3-isopropylmalate dehydratase small subunit
VRVVEGKAAPLEVDDVDTDQIIPAEFLKVLERRGLGRYLFYRWRYEGGKLTGNFVLDRPESFGDIFYGNASKNGLVCVRLSEEEVREIRERAKSGDLVLRVDVERGVVEAPYGKVYRFEMEPHVRERLVKGLDDIEITLSRYGDAIRRYEERMPRFVRPRLEGFTAE